MTTMVAPPTTHELVTLWQVANALAASGKYDAAWSAEEAYARILAGRDLGLSATDSMVHMNWLEGEFKPSAQVQGALLKAYVGADGERYDYRAIREDTQCLVTVLRKEPGGAWEEIGDVTYTMDDARRAGLHDSSDFWRQYPRRMLFWRALTEAIEAFAPHVVHPVQMPVAMPAPDALGDVDVNMLPTATANPAERQLDGEHPHPESVGGWVPLFSTIVKQHEKHGNTGRIVEALDAVGAPAGDTLAARFAALPDAAKAHEVIFRLDRNRIRRNARQKDGPATE